MTSLPPQDSPDPDHFPRVLKDHRLAAVVTAPPFSLQLDLQLPDRTELEALRQRATDARLTSPQQALAIQAFRVAEVLYEKQNQPLLAAIAAVPIICESQKRFLLSGSKTMRVDISLSDIAARTNFPVHAVVTGIRGLAVKAPIGRVSLDDLVGLVGHGPFSVPVRDIHPPLLIPTDDPGDRAAYETFITMFREGRQRILDPILVVEDPEIFPRGYVVQGHHRAAAAFATQNKIRAALLRKKDDLQYIREGFAAETAATSRTVSDFVKSCRERSRRLGLYERGWSEWSARLA